VETRRCIARLDAREDGLGMMPDYDQVEIARDGGRVVPRDWMNELLHVWDISPESGEETYERVHCLLWSIEFAFVAAAPLRVL
jgi:hypothetical protein